MTTTDLEEFSFNVVVGQEQTNVEVSHPEKIVSNYTD